MRAFNAERAAVWCCRILVTLHDTHAKIKPRLKQYLTVCLHSLLSALGGIHAEYLHFSIHFDCPVFISEAIVSIPGLKSDHCHCCILVFPLFWYIPRNALLTPRNRLMCVCVCVRVCVCVCGGGVCNVCVCVGFVMCGCLGNMYNVF
jgi:hypothetical protein